MKNLLLIVISVGGAVLSSASYASENVTYSYDALGRLVSSNIDRGAGDSKKVSICFDSAGNRNLYSIGASLASCVTTGVIDQPSPSAGPPSNYKWSANLTSAQDEICDDNSCTPVYGYNAARGIGSISNNLFNGEHVYIVSNDISGNFQLGMQGGGSAGNPVGWTSIYVPGVGLLTRSDAIFQSGMNDSGYWYWNINGSVSSGTIAFY